MGAQLPVKFTNPVLIMSPQSERDAADCPQLPNQDSVKLVSISHRRQWRETDVLSK